jgi:protein-S-isoprenylcysteine O-methyltransferase Ste14
MWYALFVAPWLLFVAWWLIRARSATRATTKESGGSRVGYGVPMVAAIVLVAWPHGLGPRLWPRSLALAVGALVLEWAGVAFALWARETLGALWSGRITLKPDHRIIRAGPYGITRHPIYTGALAGLLGVVLVRADLGTLAGFALMVLSLVRKIVIEERLLEAHFGDEYRAYRREVRAVIPFIL